MIKYKGKPMDRLVGKLLIKGIIELKTGLHIGGSETEMQIGGVDNPIIKTVNGLPYIPGSSLKGKLRSLLECATGNVTIDNGAYNPCSCGYCYICKLFGSLNEKSGRTRLIFRDCHLVNNKIPKNRLMHIKTENTIDRLTSKANPRPMERVTEGTQFSYEIILNILQSDISSLKNTSDNTLSGTEDEKTDITNENIVNDYIKLLKTAFILLENDYLGGSGSRGYGHVVFKASNNVNDVNELFEIDLIYGQLNLESIKTERLDEDNIKELIEKVSNQKKPNQNDKASDSHD